MYGVLTTCQVSNIVLSLTLPTHRCSFYTQLFKSQNQDSNLGLSGSNAYGLHERKAVFRRAMGWGLEGLAGAERGRSRDSDGA